MWLRPFCSWLLAAEGSYFGARNELLRLPPSKCSRNRYCIFPSATWLQSTLVSNGSMLRKHLPVRRLSRASFIFAALLACFAMTTTEFCSSTIAQDKSCLQPHCCGCPPAY